MTWNRVFFLAAVLSLVACTTPPPAAPPAPPPPASCASVPHCDSETRLARRGIAAEKTVQYMLQSPTLIGGKAADPAEWPASVYTKMSNGAACSATLVGDRVLFMAAHCMADGAQVTFTAHANNYKARCAHHPEYKGGRGNSTADWAMCLVDRPVTGIPFEVLGTNQLLSLQQTLTLSGYGCINPGGGGGNDGIFRTGLAIIRGMPSGKTYDVVTKGGAALCFGDSGGAAYVVSPTGVRYVVAVNSRGDIATMSYLPVVTAKTFRDWAAGWAKASNNVRVCGMHDDAVGCRSGDAKPQPDGKFQISSQSACVKGVVSPGYLDRKDAIVDVVRKALDQF